MINDLNTLVRRETQKAIKAILESRMSSDGDERRRQEDQKNAVGKRDLNASDEIEKTDEADEEGDEKDEKTDKKEPEKREDRTKGRGTADSPKLKNPDSKTLKNPTVKSVIDKLNALRGGKSLKDPDVRKSFTQYYESLSTEERQSLLLFLTGIAQVLSEVEPGDEAVEPADAGLRVKDVGDVKQKENKPKSKEGTEDNPIVVGEVASKHNIMRALREYSKYSK